MILHEINQIIGCGVWLLAQMVLLNDWGQQGHRISNVQQKTLIWHLVVASRMLFATNWKKIPAREEWIQKVQSACLMDKIL